MTPTDLINLTDAARLLSCTATTVRRYIKANKLVGWKRAGGHTLVSRADVLELLQPSVTSTTKAPERTVAQARKSTSAARERLRKAGYNV